MINNSFVQLYNQMKVIDCILDRLELPKRDENHKELSSTERLRILEKRYIRSINKNISLLEQLVERELI